MSIEPETQDFTEEQPTEGQPLVPANPGVELVAQAKARVETAPTLSEKAQALWALPPEMRHATLGALSAPLVAALIENDPEHNLALLGNVPAAKFQQIAHLGTPEQGRAWLERAVASGTQAGPLLPSLMNANELAGMLLSSPDVRRILPKLLNYERAERWRQLLTTNEWHANIDELLMADTHELLGKAPIKDKSIKAVLQSLLDYVPELYLETITLATQRAKYDEDRPEEHDDLTSTPFGLPELAATAVPDEAANPNAARARAEADTSPLTELIPEGGDPVFALATAGLTAIRKAQLEEQLKNLLRQEIVATASFAQAEMARAAGRVLFYLRVGLESFGSSVEDATRALETHQLLEVSALGARAAESYRQQALSLAGLRDWLDSRQRQFLDAMKQPEAGIHPQTREPVLWLAGRARQARADWHPTPLSEITARLSDAQAWGSLARAAFGSPDRIHTIFNTAKTRTWDEALRRTVVALVLYHRWEPELIRPGEDYAAFRRQYGTGKKNGIDMVRQIVLDALEITPDAAWKPSRAKSQARELLLRAISEVETMPLPPAPAPNRRSNDNES